MNLEITPAEDTTTLDRLRRVAVELFAERGYAGASLADIASRIGIRKPSLYNYYKSKDELFLDLLSSSIDAWSAASDPALDGMAPARERLQRHLQATVGFATDQPHVVGMCRVAVSHVGDDLAPRVEALLGGYRRQYQERLERFFSGAVERGEIDDVGVDVLVLSWLTFLDGILTHHLFGTGERRQRYLEHLDGLWQVFWRGIGARPENAS